MPDKPLCQSWVRCPNQTTASSVRPGWAYREAFCASGPRRLSDARRPTSRGSLPRDPASRVDRSSSLATLSCRYRRTEAPSESDRLLSSPHSFANVSPPQGEPTLVGHSFARRSRCREIDSRRAFSLTLQLLSQPVVVRFRERMQQVGFTLDHPLSLCL